MTVPRNTVELAAGQFTYVDAGNDDPVVFLHALGKSALDWTEVIRQLSARWRCLSLDLRGHGGSAHTPTYSFDEMAEDVHDFIVELDIDHLRLVGHSMGANVAWKYALRWPVERLVIEDTVPPGGIDTLPAPPDGPDSDIDYDWQARVQISRELNGPSWQDSLNGVTCPVLLVAGRPDDPDMMNVDHLLSNSRLEMLEEGHWIHRRDPLGFSQLLETFL